MATSFAFYTKVLDFDCIEYGGDGDPTFCLLMPVMASLDKQ
jgi:hypothetical protein